VTGPPRHGTSRPAVSDADLAEAGRRVVAEALAEDLGDRGDVTSRATVPPGATGAARLVARADGVVCGVDLVRETFAQVDAAVRVDLTVADGDTVARGDVLGEVIGPLASVLTGERTALNLLTHLSGVATATRRLVDAVAGTGCDVRDTRKTTPGLRLLEKHAVRVGGGVNHRVGLHDALLVKDNHVAAAGSVTAAVTAALANADGLPVQVEVASLDELDEALAAGADDLLLDNFTPAEVRVAVERVAGRATLEASGTIDHTTARAYAETGVDRVAVGAITHSARVLDIALDVALDAARPGGGA
jgi:nicotinate-nucleotide pyrophosphorylase (carboxylating)